VLSAIGRVELAVTSSLTINFLRKPPPAGIRAEAKLLKLGSRLAVGEGRALYRGSQRDGRSFVATYRDSLARETHKGRGKMIPYILSH